MLEAILPALVGASGIAGAYVAYKGVTKGVPAVYSAVKTRLTSGTTALASVKADVATAHSKIAALETKVGTIASKVGL
jgi:hypothetical protein